VKYLLVGAAAAALLAAAAGSAQAQTTYTNSALNGCYAHHSTSVDTEPGAVNRDNVGTLCFDGNGNIVGTSGTPALSGHVSNSDGTAKTTTDEAATYAVTNTPGDGMGTFTFRCNSDAFVLKNIDANGLAHGFDFILTQRTGKCSGPEVIGGGAEYQGPLK